MAGEKGTTSYRGPLGQGDVVYRVLGSAQQITPLTGKPVLDQFLRRPPDKNGNPRDTRGFSLVVLNGLSFDEFAAYQRGRNPPFYCYAFAQLEVEEVIAIETTPTLRLEQDGNYHVTLHGLPSYEEYKEDDTHAKRLAAQLMGISRVDPWRNPLTRPKR